MTPANILVVEDDRIVARDIQQQLVRAGHRVVGATARGDEALALALELRPDLVLMDIRLEGEIDGVDAAGLIRDRCRVPVVFLTAYADDETVHRASIAEPFGYLLKPFDETHLRTVIEMALYKHGAERRLRESERRYATTLASIGDAVIATNMHAEVTYLNQVAEALTGWNQAEAAGQPVAEVFRIVNEETRQTVEDPVAKVLRLGVTVGLANHTVLLSKDGREIPIDDCGSPIVDDYGDVTGAVLVFRDISERYKAEESLRRTQQDLARMGRMTAMGELTVSIAHEINQPLMAIVTNAAACLNWLSEDNLNIKEARSAAGRIVRDGHRAGDVVASIRALARKSTPEMSTIDLNESILEVLVLMRSELRRHAITTRTDLSNTASLVKGDRIQLQQVILNLVMNAAEAISGTSHQPRLLCVTSRRGEAGFVVVSVSDTGEGIDLGSEDRIFDAFFTTKAEGIGMGLSICKSIVEAHGGRLWVGPNTPHGSVFQFTIPLVSDEQSDN